MSRPKSFITAAAVAAVAFVCASTGGRAAEGMWTLDNPPLKAMQAELGWAPDAAWLDHAMRSSARFGQGCSSSFVSKTGLVLTNHHCAATCIGELSTADSNLMETGFLAKVQADERRCPATEVQRLEAMTDVTADVTKATAGTAGSAFKAAQNAVKAKLASACAAGDERYRCDVVDLYHGGQFKLYRYRRFRDVRLVFAPERAIAFFGGDPDNFNFPRYDLDMTIVRVYDDGKPITVTDYFPISPKGPAAGDAVVSLGNPGSTQRELTVAQLALLRDQTLIDLLTGTAEYRGVLTQYISEGPEQARTGRNELFGVENRYKVFRGELSALVDERFFATKVANENALRQYVATHPELASSADAWDAIARATQTRRGLDHEHAFVEDGRALDTRYYQSARTLVRAAAERTKADAERLPEYNDNRLPQLESRVTANAPVYPALEKRKLAFSLTKFREILGADHPLVRRVLGKASPEEMASDFVDRTKLGDAAYRRQLWDGGAAAIAASDDPFVRLAIAIDPDARAIRARYEREVDAVVQTNTDKIAKARFAMAGDTIYPDATGTLRLSYGVVRGWEENGRTIPAITDFAGAFDRATGSYPFALPASWIANRSRIDGKVPYNVSTTNDIIGGNSGSPIVDRRRQLVGLLFDGNIHSLGGAYGYDPALNRSVAVDSAAIFEALDHIYDAPGLAAELRAR